MRNVIMVLGAGLLLVAVNAAAEDAPAAAEKTPAAAPAAQTNGAGGAPKYGPAGCGLGSLLFKPDSGFTQVFAATTNASFYSQTFGISSGTSNCDTGPSSSQSAKAFVQTNRAALAKDIARGRGETISSLSALAGCSSPHAVGVKLQHSFHAIFSSVQATDEQVSDSVVNLLSSDTSLSCSNLG